MPANKDNNNDISGKTIIITGANSGIGYEAALNFSCRGANVGLVCRSRERGEQALNKIKKLSGSQNLNLFIADFSQVKQIPKLAQQINTRYPSIDVLCNNAGSVQRQHIITDEGFEWTMAVNHLSGFALSKWLMPNLKRAAAQSQARIVFTSSVAHKRAAIDFDNLNLVGNYSILNAYGKSKLMNVLTARQMQKVVGKDNIVVSSFHPGVVSTGIWKYGGAIVGFLGVLAKPFVLNAKQGAETLVWLATSNDEASSNANGNYFFECKRAETGDFVSDNSAEQMWQQSLTLLKNYLPAKETEIA